MKKVISLVALTLIIASGISLKAQTYKFGHIDSQKLMGEMPESQQAQKTLEAEQKSIRDQLETMQVELNNKLNDYQEKSGGWSDIIKADKEKEMNSLNQRIQEFQQTASQQLQKKQAELYQPILEKVQNAIKEVAKENKFTYIFEVQSLLYHSEESIDITGMVKAKLAVK
jgi:outer membrane protein